MPPLSVNNFVGVVNTQTNRHLEVVDHGGGRKDVVRGQSNLGTKAVQWLRNFLHVKDPATKAFKAAVRRELGNDDALAQQVFQHAGIKSRKPLTEQKVQLASHKLGELLAPRHDENEIKILKEPRLNQSTSEDK